MKALSPGLMVCRKCNDWTFYSTLREGDKFVHAHRHGLAWASVMVMPRYKPDRKEQAA